jgi:hypothetical protein
MIKYESFKNQIIIILFSLSIFLSFISFSFLEFRFLYLLVFFFLIYDSSFLKKIPLNYTLISFIIPLLIFLYSSVFLFVNFNDINFYKFILDPLTINSLIKKFIQCVVISLTILIILFYKKFLVLNILKIIDYFVVIFILLIFFYSVNNKGILLETLYTCDLGFFYITKFLFFENSHFALISIPVISSFIYNIKIYLKKYFMLFFYLLFLIFSLGTFSLTFYLSMFSSIIIIFITTKNMSKISKFLFIILLIIINLLFFMDKEEFKFYQSGPTYGMVESKFAKACYSKGRYLKFKQQQEFGILTLATEKQPYEGIVLTEKQKFESIFKNKNKNLSTGIVIYNMYVAKKSLINNPFGVGIGNYIKYREMFDRTLNIKKSLSYSKEILGHEHWDKKKYAAPPPDLVGEIIFEERYMPSLPSTILVFNRNSGSNNISKLIVEFGLISTLGLFLIFIFSFRKEIDDPIKVTLIPLIFIQCFIRGTGYFNSGFIISLIIVLIIICEQILKKHENKNIK